MSEPTNGAPPKPVTYEIVRTTYYNLGQPGTVRPVYVREKQDRSGFYGSQFQSTEEASEVSLTELLTRIVQSLEELGIEIVQEPAKSATLQFRKRAAETQEAGQK